MVHDTEIELSRSITLIGGNAEPPDRLCLVLGNTLSFHIQESESELGFGVTLVGSSTQSLHRSGDSMHIAFVGGVELDITTLSD